MVVGSFGALVILPILVSARIVAARSYWYSLRAKSTQSWCSPNGRMNFCKNSTSCLVAVVVVVVIV